MWVGVVTLFPQLVASYFEQGIMARAKNEGLLELAFVNPRDLTTDAHQTVDDKPFGGGPGMVLKPEPLDRAVRVAKLRCPVDNPKVVMLSPSGRRLDQSLVTDLKDEALIFVCGRYEGIDQRFIDEHVDLEVSIGDYVLSGGELGALVMIDSIARLLPGVLGQQHSLDTESFSDELNGGLEGPQYTRPSVYKGRRVPDVLVSGNHKAIEQWRLSQALEKTAQVRPDLLVDDKSQ